MSGKNEICVKRSSAKLIKSVLMKNTKFAMHPHTRNVAYFVALSSAFIGPAEAVSKETVRELAIVTKFTSILGIIGALWAISHILRNKKRRESSYHRIVLGMGIFMFIFSLATLLSTWPIPVEDASSWGNVGTVGTCNVQGFMIQFGIGIPLYSSCLAVHFLLVIRYNYSEAKLRRAERYMHTIVLTFSFATATAGVFLELYNNSILWCAIKSYPADCHNNADECVRGAKAHLYIWYFYYIPTWFATITVTVIMITVYRTIRGRENAMKKYTRHTMRQGQRHRQSRRMATQAILYVAAFYVTWIPATAGLMILSIGVGDPQPVLVVAAVFCPMQGLFHVLSYMACRMKRYRQEMSVVVSSLGRSIAWTATSSWSFFSISPSRRKISTADRNPKEGTKHSKRSSGGEPNAEPEEASQSVEVDGATTS